MDRRRDSYATHGEPMIPIYIFYSMFGFQRTGDQLWAAADQLTRGFLLGATAGRTTLNGEGLQHQDGHSLLLASTNPACVSYDPAFGFELGHIVRDALRRMYGEPAQGEDPTSSTTSPFTTNPSPSPLSPTKWTWRGSSLECTCTRRRQRTGDLAPRSSPPGSLCRGRSRHRRCCDDWG